MVTYNIAKNNTSIDAVCKHEHTGQIRDLYLINFTHNKFSLKCPLAIAPYSYQTMCLVILVSI